MLIKTIAQFIINEAKHAAAQEWVTAVNADGKFGNWDFKVLDDPKNLFEVVKQ